MLCLRGMETRLKPLTACRAVVAVVVLCGFYEVRFASAQSPAAGSETDKSDAEHGSTTTRKNALSSLAIGIGPNDPFPFGIEGGSGNDGEADEVLFHDSAAGGVRSSIGRFSCGGQASLAIERPNVAVRRLVVWLTKEAGILDNLGLGASQKAKHSDVWVTDGQLKVLSLEGAEDSSALEAVLETPLPNGTKIQAGVENDRTRGLAVQYYCRQEGKAIVELRLRAGSSDGSTRNVCMRWVKHCSMGWRDLKIDQGDAAVLVDGQIQEDWSQRMINEGTHDSVAKFELSAEGVEVIRRPFARSNQQLVEVDILGPFAHSTSDQFEISTEPQTLSVKLDCRFDGFAEVTLFIEKATLSDDKGEMLEIKFRKVCGTSAYQHLEVNIKSEKYKNKTKAVEKGAVLPGFAQPCKDAESKALAKALRHHQDFHEQCDAGPPVLMIPEKELRTVLELEIDKWAMGMPTFSPQADVTFDSKVMMVRVLQAPLISQTNSRSGGKGGPKNKHQTLTLKYTCYKDGESMVMLTLHVLSYKSINIAWRKKCIEPKAKIGKALTAPQAIMVTMFVCGIIVLIACMIFMFGGGEKESAADPKKKGYNRAAVTDNFPDSGGDVELPAKVVGAQEVIYHS